MSLTECRQAWRRAGVAGLLAVAVLVGAILSAGAAPAPEPRKKEEPAKEEAKKEEAKKDNLRPDAFDGLPSVEDMLRHMPAGMTPEQVKQMRMQAQRAMEAVRRMPAPGLGGLPPGFPFNPFRSAEEERLGVQTQKPIDILVEQLDLPKGQGLVIAEVEKDSAAGKGGVKPHDILLEVNGKAVSSDVRELGTVLGEVKANTPVEVVVLRKGKKETLKGLTLPEARKALAPAFPVPPLMPLPVPIPPAVPLPLVPPFPALGGFGGGDRGVLTVVFRTGNRFTTRHEEGSLIITVTGTVTDGKAKVSEIHVQDGAVVEKGDSAAALPERYRDKVKNLLELSEKTAVKVEIKGP